MFGCRGEIDHSVGRGGLRGRVRGQDGNGCSGVKRERKREGGLMVGLKSHYGDEEVMEDGQAVNKMCRCLRVTRWRIAG